VKSVRGLLVVIIFLFPEKSQAQSSELTKVPINTRNGNPRGYIEYLPKGFDASGTTKYPVLYWLHGLSEKGAGSTTDLEKVLNTQISLWLKSNDIDFIVIVPQDKDGYWNGTPTRLRTFVEWVNQEYAKAIDPGQQHLAGLSAGGYGVRDFILENSEVSHAFSTFTFMATNVNAINTYASTIVGNDQYVWFHQGADDIVPNTVNDVKTLHTRILALDSARSRLTVYDQIGHSAWDKVYNGSGMTSDQAISTTVPYYSWTLDDIDVDWYGWMKSCGKSLLNRAEPSTIRLSDFELDENNVINASLGVINANGQKPVAVRLVPHAADNDLFYLAGNHLMANAVFDFEERSSYTISVEAFNEVGTLVRNFDITVKDVYEAILGEEDEMAGLESISAYPNPMLSDRFFLRSTRADIVLSTVEVINPDGRKSQLASAVSLCREESLELSLGDRKPGIYFIRIIAGNSSTVLKLLKK